MLWGTYFINCRLIEIGRLQYEYFDGKTIKMHIPRGSRLDINEVVHSIKMSQQYIKKYFNTVNFNYECESWLLSKQIHALVDENSNIYQFYDLFEVIEGEDCLGDILNFVFEKSKIMDYSELSENTSLQRKVKEYLIKQKEITIGQGKLKRDYEKGDYGIALHNENRKEDYSK